MVTCSGVRNHADGQNRSKWYGRAPRTSSGLESPLDETQRLVLEVRLQYVERRAPWQRLDRPGHELTRRRQLDRDLVGVDDCQIGGREPSCNVLRPATERAAEIGSGRVDPTALDHHVALGEQERISFERHPHCCRDLSTGSGDSAHFGQTCGPIGEELHPCEQIAQSNSSW